MKEAMQKLSKIQKEMKAPKNKRNTFGNYNYRNAEDILEAFKPYIDKYGVSLVVSDEVKNFGDRYYIEATATLYDVDTGQSIAAKALAREAPTKKGMDDSQITGTASSYARKYALNGLFLLDDTKDADTDEARIESDKISERQKDDSKNQEVIDEAKDRVIDQAKINTIQEALKKAVMSRGDFFRKYEIKSFDEVTIDMFIHFMEEHGEK